MTKLQSLILTALLALMVMSKVHAEAPKIPPRGVVDRTRWAPDDWSAIVNHRNLELGWSELEPSPPRNGVHAYAFERIDSVLEQALLRNARVHLRVWAGRRTPAWIGQEVGVVRMRNAWDGIEADVPRWWDSTFLAHYQRLMTDLAARYDQHPQLSLVMITGPQTIWAEPCIRELSDSATREALAKSGFTTEIDRKTISAFIAIHAQAWRKTPSSLALNPYEVLASDGLGGWVRKVDIDSTFGMMEEMVAVLGDRAVLQNNSLRWDVPTDTVALGPAYAKLYDRMARWGRMGTHIGIQTAASDNDRVGDLAKVLGFCREVLGASFVELPQRYNEHSPADRPSLNLEGTQQLAIFDSAFEALANARIKVVSRTRDRHLGRQTNDLRTVPNGPHDAKGRPDQRGLNPVAKTVGMGLQTAR